MEITDTLGFLIGTWRVTRWLDDHRSGTHGRFAGSASWREEVGDEDTADFQENGEMRLGNHAGPARRRLRYTRSRGSAVMIYFPDGRPFVDLDLGNGTWRGEHPCRSDRYQITTVARSAASFEERWRVKGPSKDYQAVTIYVRAGRPHNETGNVRALAQPGTSTRSPRRNTAGCPGGAAGSLPVATSRLAASTCTTDGR